MDTIGIGICLTVFVISTIVVSIIASEHIPKSVLEWYKKRDKRWDCFASMVALTFTAIMGLIVMLSTFHGGAVWVDAMKFNEGYAEVPLMAVLYLFLFVWSMFNYRILIDGGKTDE